MNNFQLIFNNNIRTASLQSLRFVSGNKYDWKGEGIQCGLIKYYPKNNESIEPIKTDRAKLFRVQRISFLKGIPHFEKKILRQFKLDGKQSDVAIIKNTPENNTMLWKIKHLIKIDPITFPNGFPTSPESTCLKENGELMVTKRLVPNEERISALDGFKSDVKRMNGDTLRRELRKRWLSGW